MNLLENKINSVLKSVLSRRKFLATGLITAASYLIPRKTLAAVEDLSPERELYLYNVYTEESLKTVYWREGQYLSGALSEINYILRDIHNGKVKSINTNLIDLIFTLKKNLKTDSPFHIVSGYRTPGTNALLRKRRKGVAKNSLHMYGKAVDLRLPDYSLKVVRRTAMELKGGGVGYYPRSGFVHIDVGNIRYWRG